MTGALETAGLAGRLLAATARIVVVCVLVAFAATAAAATASEGARIQKCKDASGKPLATDPTDSRCYTPPPTEAQKAAMEEERRRAEEAYQACRAEQRSLQSLLSRYPDKAKHDAARALALSQVEASIRVAEARMAQLQAERKHLLDEAEFYPAGNLPPKLKRDLDANSAVIAAQMQAIANQKEEAEQKNKFYDEELAKLKKLWTAKGADSRPCVAPRD